jgi:hypothetical protein
MISAFGVEHGVISKAKPKGPRYEPTAEQRAASAANKAKQAAESLRLKQEKFNTRVGGGAKLGWKAHRAAMGKTPEFLAATTAVGGGALYALHRRTKFDRKKAENAGLGAVAGATGSYTATFAGGQAGKIALKERRAKRGESPREKQVWQEHAKKYPTTSEEPFLQVKRDGGKPKIKIRQNKYKSYQHYPKDLPDWKGQRLLAHTGGSPRFTAGVVGAATAGGAAYGVHRTKRSRGN